MSRTSLPNPKRAVESVNERNIEARKLPNSLLRRDEGKVSRGEVKKKNV